MSSSAFATLPLSNELLTVVSELGFEKMTPIQEQSIPLLLAGKDLVGQSKTGSGKTAAFALPILNKIDLDNPYVQALVLCPTRELCTQVAREIRTLGRRHPGLHVLILSGGVPGKPQMFALQKGAHIVVGTPGRVLDHIDRGNLDLSGVSTLVLDEADRMLDMGFEEDMQLIMDEAPGTRQTVFFSATFPPSIKAMSKRYQHSPVHVTIEDTEEKPLIEQVVYEMPPENKREALIRLLQLHEPEGVMVFCNLKATVAELGRELKIAGISSDALHGDLEQVDRDRVMAKFRNGSIRVLVATDVAARGIDIKSLPMVVNYDLPHQAEVYIHRIGRTGRAGEKGLAVSLASPMEKTWIGEIEAETGSKIQRFTLNDLRDQTSGKKHHKLQGASMQTLFISGGRKEKVRPGDILGALTGEAGGLSGSEIGKIEIHDHFSYVAVSSSIAQTACQRLRDGRIKGRKFQIKIVD